jgi:hypothetical protein
MGINNLMNSQGVRQLIDSVCVKRIRIPNTYDCQPSRERLLSPSPLPRGRVGEGVREGRRGGLIGLGRGFDKASHDKEVGEYAVLLFRGPFGLSFC